MTRLKIYKEFTKSLGRPAGPFYKISEMKIKTAAYCLALTGFAFWALHPKKEPKKADPRYAAVAAEQIRHRIDFIFTP